MLILAHNPKCFGTSIREIFIKQVTFHNPWINYSKRWDTGNLKKNTLSDNTDFICGHICPKSFSAFFPDSILITSIRHPVTRTLSLYNHFYAQNNISQSTTIKTNNNTWITLEEFIHKDEYQNYTSKYFGGIDLQKFFFVVICEDFKNSLIKLSRKLKLGFELRPTHENKRIYNFNINKRIKNIILDNNKEDLSLYNSLINQNY